MAPLLAAFGELGPLLAEGGELFKGFSSGLEAVTGDLGKLGKEFGLTKEKAKSFFDGLGVMDFTDPYKVLGAAVRKIGDLLVESTQAAMKFNHEFLVLANMNLDKSSKQIENLNDQILGLSITKGLDPNETVKSFSTIQRLTGKYGDEVGGIVEKVTRFSDAVGANNEKMISSVGRGIDAFKLDGDQVDGYLSSQAKTTKLAAVSYDELATAQTKYMDAAVNAGQGYETANKFFTAFNRITHDAERSASLTQSVFAGFADGNVRDALSEIGVAFTDANGQMLESTKVLDQLKEKFRNMGNKEFTGFLDKMGGTGDMKEAFGLIRDKGGNMSSSFAGFDTTSADTNKMLANADGDAATQWEKVNNQLDGMMVSLGQMFLPAITEALRFISDKLAGTVGLFTAINTESGTFANWLKMAVSIFETIWTVANFFTLVIAKAYARVIEFIGRSEFLGDLFGFVSEVFSGIATGLGYVTDVLAFGVERFLIPFRLLEGLYRLVKSEVLPAIERFFGKVGNLFGQASEWANNMITEIATKITEAFPWIGEFFTKAQELFDKVSDWISSKVDLITEKIREFIRFLGPVGEALGLSMPKEEAKKSPSVFEIGRNYLGEENVDRLKSEPALVESLKNKYGVKDLNDISKLIKQGKAGELKGAIEGFGKDEVKPPGTNPAANPLGNSGLGDAVKTINDGGKSIRNVTVSINKLVETINNNVSNVSEGMRNAEDVVLEGLVRIVRDSEMALGNAV